MHRLDAASGPEVEHACSGHRDHQPREGHRRTADAEHVLLAERVAQRELAEVGEDPPPTFAERIGEFVRSQIE
jgi:hypothetical protein